MSASSPLAGALDQWQRDGCLVVENALGGDELARLQEAFARCAASARDEWLRGVARGEAPAAFFDIPRPLERDPLFVDLVDHPSYYPLVRQIAGGRPLFIFAQFRTLPPSPLSYVGWHYDVVPTAPLHFKVQLYLDDVGPDQGAFAYVPGSHRPGAGPYPCVRRLESMPGQRVFFGAAGTALVFDSHGMHTSMVNRGPRPRRSIILAYERFAEESFDPTRFAALAEQLQGDERRRLFGLERHP